MRLCCWNFARIAKQGTAKFKKAFSSSCWHAFALDVFDIATSKGTSRCVVDRQPEKRNKSDMYPARFQSAFPRTFVAFVAFTRDNSGSLAYRTSVYARGSSIPRFFMGFTCCYRLRAFASPLSLPSQSAIARGSLNRAKLKFPPCGYKRRSYHYSICIHLSRKDVRCARCV